MRTFYLGKMLQILKVSDMYKRNEWKLKIRQYQPALYIGIVYKSFEAYHEYARIFLVCWFATEISLYLQ